MTLLPIPTDPVDWHALRARHVGSSEVAALFDCQPDYAPGLMALWAAKAGLAPRGDATTARAAWGLKLEDAIAQFAAEQEGWTVLPGVYASRGGLGASLDRRIDAPSERDVAEGFAGPGVLELKNADWLAHRRAWGDEPPLHVLLQHQAQMLASGLTWGAVAVLVGGNDLRVYRYPARPGLQAEIAKRVEDFWASVRDGRRPNADASDATFRALAAMHPDASDEGADLTDDAETRALCLSYLQAQAAEKAAGHAKDLARNRLMERLAGARWAKVDGYKLSVAVTPAREDRVAGPGEVIKGRAESRRIIVQEKSS